MSIPAEKCIQPKVGISYNDPNMSSKKILQDRDKKILHQHGGILERDED